MVEEQKFKTKIFGGFEKKCVVDYIDSLMTKFKDEIKSLEQQHSSQLEELSKQKSQYKCLVVEIQRLKNKIRVNDNNYQKIIEKKNQHLDSKEQTMRELNDKINKLNAKIMQYEQMENIQTKRVEKSEQIAKERTNQLIKQAKFQVEQEYKTKMDQADQEIKALHKKAREEASQILRNAAKRANQVTTQFKEESERIIDSAKAKAESIINYANLNYNEKEMDSNIKFDLDLLQNEIEREVEVALKHLDSAELSVKTFKDKIEKIKVPERTVQGKSSMNSINKYKRAINNIFNSKYKE